MSHQCPFPVRSTDSRCGYRTGSLPGLAFSLALIAALTCFAGICHADAVQTASAAAPGLVSLAGHVSPQ